MWHIISLYLGMIRFSHTLFALPFALFSSMLAWWKVEPFQWIDLLGIFLCMVFARSAAMAFNRLVDARYDALNPRTAKRHIPAGLLSKAQVWGFTLICSVFFVCSTLLFLPNQWPLYLSVPILLFLMAYSYVKRFSMWCHYWLAAALMLSPLAAWIAITGTVSLPPVLLAAAVYFWVGGFDIIYACQDTEFDTSQQLYSIPSRLGVKNALRIARLSHLLMIISLFGLWQVAGLGNVYLLSVLIVAIMLAYEHLIVSPHDLTRVNVAFFQVNWMLSVGMLMMGLLDLVLSSS